jgi:RimJ/RimL family protein N-acetyltransferase
LEDYPASAAMWGDANVVRYISGTPSSAQQSWMRVLSYAGHWQLLGFGYWVIEETASRVFAGEVGFADFKRGVDPSLEGIPEIGWALTSDMQGRGLGTEAVRAAVAWSDRNRRWQQTTCLIREANALSIRVATKCGYTELRRFEHGGNRTALFTRAGRSEVAQA